VPAGDAELRRAAGNGAVHLEVRSAVLADGHLGVVPVQVAGRAERLGDGLLDRESGGQGLTRALRARRRRLLVGREQPVAQPRRAGQRLGEPVDRHDVDPDADDHPASLPPSAPGPDPRLAPSLRGVRRSGSFIPP
jgi:hypothetical protein